MDELASIPKLKLNPGKSLMAGPGAVEVHWVAQTNELHCSVQV